MARYRYRVDGAEGSIEADAWRRELGSDDVVFIRRRWDTAALVDDEVLRLHVELPHRHIVRLPRQSGDL